jgi:hypothetical protein
MPAQMCDQQQHSLHSPLVSHVFAAVQRAENPPNAPGRQEAAHVLPTVRPVQPTQSWAFKGFVGVGLLLQVLGPGIAAAAQRMQQAVLILGTGWHGKRLEPHDVPLRHTCRQHAPSQGDQSDYVVLSV